MRGLRLERPKIGWEVVDNLFGIGQMEVEVLGDCRAYLFGIRIPMFIARRLIL